MSEKLLDEIPSLDLADFRSGDPQRKAKFVQDLGEAYQNIGFVALKNHGLNDEQTQTLYRESLKHRTAYDLRVITVGKVTTPLNVDLAGKHMFYSRPKGEYTGKDAQKVMLDFYLVNTTLGPDDNKVRATINGTEFMLDQWAPYMMEGLPMGQNTVKLELVDASGNLVPGPYNSVTRTFTLAQ